MILVSSINTLVQPLGVPRSFPGQCPQRGEPLVGSLATLRVRLA